jgi:hypothetical protein
MKKFLIVAIAACFMFTTGIASAQQATNVNTGVIGGGQGQGQGQSQAINGPLYIDNSYHEASDLARGRQFANPATQQFGPVLNYFGQPLPSEGFQPVEQLLMYSCWFTEGSLESMLKGVEKADAEFKVANNRIAAAKPAAEDGETKWIKIVISRDKYEGANVGFKGFITAKSENRDTTMTEVMAKAALTAIENGCNVIHFTAQGAVRDVMASGWGIGFNTTQAQVYSGDLTKSNVSSGGMGYSSAKAGTRDLPWLQGFGLVDNDLVYPVLDLPATEIDANNADLNPAPENHGSESGHR